MTILEIGNNVRIITSYANTIEGIVIKLNKYTAVIQTSKRRPIEINYTDIKSCELMEELI